MNIKYVICPGDNPSQEFVNTYNQIYNCWKTVWESTYKELKIDKHLYADSFTRQTNVGAIFYDDICMAMCFFRHTDFNLSSFGDDSYFSCWSESNRNQLKANGHKIIVSSNFTIHPLARKGNLPFSMKDLLTGISVEYFLNSNADSMAANLRVDRKVNESCKKWGAHLIEANVTASNGEPGDLMYFHKQQNETDQTNENYLMVKKLWAERMEVPVQTPAQAPVQNILHSLRHKDTQTFSSKETVI